MSRLNEAERAVLRLLAEGHTAKSIAAMIGSTTAAVNERLREARRKTGVGSSRELARLLKAQETCDEQIGISSASAAEAPSSRRSFLQRKGAVAMVFIVAIAATAALIQLSLTRPSRPRRSSPTQTWARSRWLGPAGCTRLSGRNPATILGPRELRKPFATAIRMCSSSTKRPEFCE
jgi:DNA-binding CsgD family transcriptional regulator